MVEPEKPPVPPFTLETATKKVKAAEDAWNSCDPAKVSMAYTPGSDTSRERYHLGLHACCYHPNTSRER